MDGYGAVSLIICISYKYGWVVLGCVCHVYKSEGVYVINTLGCNYVRNGNQLTK